MPDLSHESAVEFWNSFMGGSVAPIITFIEHTEDWVDSQNLSTEEALNKLGEYLDTVTPGLHWNPPFIDTVTVVRVTEERQYQNSARDLMLTEDENIVDLQLAVQYNIADPKAFVLNVKDPEFSLQHATQSALRHVVGSSKLDQVISTGREQVAFEVKERIQQYLDAWYKSRALERLTDKTTRYAEQIGVSPSGISVRNFKSRWGSCDSRGQLLFNWNIIKAPHAIADYVVVHELCHLVHPNHSKDFWALVGRFDPAYAEHRDWLKQNKYLLL